MKRRRDELLSAAVWAVLGVAILAASWRMDRLEDRGINPWSAPGLTPGMVGALIIALALALAWPSRDADDGRDDDTAAARNGGGKEGTMAAVSAPDAQADAAVDGPGAWRRTMLALALCVGFAGLALGRGLPFVVESVVFIFAFTTVFSLPLWRARGRVVRGLVQTAAVAIVTSLFVSWLFESVFLVRLP